jgi:hypothetical protein
MAVTGSPHVQYVLSYEELKAALKTHQLVSIKWRGLLIFWAIVIAILAILSFQFGDPNYPWHQFAAMTGGGIIGSGIVIAALYWLANPYHARRQMKQSIGLSDEIGFTYHEDGVEFNAEHGDTRLKWHELHQWAENKQLFLLYISGQLFMMLPKRALGAEDLMKVRQMLNDKGPKQAKPLLSFRG